MVVVVVWGRVVKWRPPHVWIVDSKRGAGGFPKIAQGAWARPAAPVRPLPPGTASHRRSQGKNPVTGGFCDEGSKQFVFIYNRNFISITFSMWNHLLYFNSLSIHVLTSIQNNYWRGFQVGFFWWWFGSRPATSSYDFRKPVCGVRWVAAAPATPTPSPRWCGCPSMPRLGSHRNRPGLLLCPSGAESDGGWRYGRLGIWV